MLQTLLAVLHGLVARVREGKIVATGRVLSLTHGTQVAYLGGEMVLPQGGMVLPQGEMAENLGGMAENCSPRAENLGGMARSVNLGRCISE